MLYYDYCYFYVTIVLKIKGEELSSMKRPELLVPVGDFDSLKAAVQNGADAVYLGIHEFNARYSAKNFTLNTIQEAIDYAHLRHVQVHFTFNVLMKDTEWQQAITILKHVYQLGIDAIIVQDLGVLRFIVEHFPNLPVHASTQMTCHNLESALYLQTLGVKRIVLARELSLNEIAHITSHLSAEVEVFSHGALCISYSGQCLYSSIIGGRSGNRGKCAQGCRLPYSLLENTMCIDKGYLLSPRDLCSLECLPALLATNVDSLKIEGRMKSPEYVATVTSIYRKQIDKILNGEEYSIDEQDKHNLLQVFNRGGFSAGHLLSAPNHDLIYKEKPNHMGIFLGQVTHYSSSKGHITLHVQDALSIGDTITFEKEPTKYTVSEIMKNGNNVDIVKINDKIEIGRMKGNISVGDKIYKLSSKELTDEAIQSFSNENKKTPLSAVLDVHLDEPIQLRVFDDAGIEFTLTSKEVPDVAVRLPITKERLEKQLCKTTNTPFYFKNIKIHLEDHLYIPHISAINELRRLALEQYANVICQQYRRELPTLNEAPCASVEKPTSLPHPQIAVLLNILHKNFDYQALQNIDKLYIPLAYFEDEQYTAILQTLTQKYKTYLYLPTILKDNYKNVFKNRIAYCLDKYSIQGFVISHLGYLELLKEYKINYEFIGNYTLNVFNTHTAAALDVPTITISPELNHKEICSLASSTQKATEFIVYGNLPLMTMQYCLLGTANKCYPQCSQKCKKDTVYYLKDRMNFKFRIIPDPIQTVTTIYNSKITSIPSSDLIVDYLRIDILDEPIEEINHIIDTVIHGNRLEGQSYTNGNLYRNI